MDEHAASLAKLIHGRTRRLYRDLEELRRLTAELVQQLDTPKEGDTTNGRNNGSTTQSRAEAETGVAR